MNNRSNTIVLIVGIVLVVSTTLILFMSCNSSGGGGAPAASHPNSNSAQQYQAPVNETANQTVQNTQANNANANSDGQQTSNTTTQTPTSSSTGSQWETGDFEADAKRLKEEIRNSVKLGNNVRDAATSPNATPASKTYADLSARGFSDVNLVSDYNMQGDYTSDTVIDRASSETYPSYQGYYLSSNDVLWIITVNDGNVIAVPIANKDVEIQKEIIITESDHVVQYDGLTNTYSDWPVGQIDQNVIAIQVTRIDTSLLDSYTTDSLGRM